MKVLVTGGAGFIGSHLVDALVSEGHRVLVFDNLSNGKKENINPQAKFYQLDIAKDDIESLLRKERPQAIFHFAAQINLRKSLEDPVYDAEQNIIGSLHLFESAAKAGAKYFIFASTGGAMCPKGPFPFKESDKPSPSSPYGLAKLSVENYFLNYYGFLRGLKTAVLRFSNVYGPRQDAQGEAGVVAIFCDRLRRGLPPVIFGDGRQSRDFVYVDDVVRACLLCLKNKRQGIFHIGTGRETTVNTIAKKLLKISSQTGPISSPAKPVRPASLVGVRQIQHAPKILGEARRSVLDPRLAWKTFGWRAEVGIKDGLKKTWEWFNK